MKSNLNLVLRAAAMATLTVGTLSAGLTVTTYTVAKANEMVFDSAAVNSNRQKPGQRVCL
ncbi:MAG: hypothetical protein AAGA23_17175 [Pseudomonadota bacterium]